MTFNSRKLPPSILHIFNAVCDTLPESPTIRFETGKLTIRDKNGSARTCHGFRIVQEGENVAKGYATQFTIAASPLDTGSFIVEVQFPDGKKPGVFSAPSGTTPQQFGNIAREALFPKTP
jgi:hypothetical protein